MTKVKSLKWEMSRSRKPKLHQNNLKSWAGCWEVSPPLLNVIDFFLCVFKCNKGVDQTWMSLNYTPFLLLVKSKMTYGEGGVGKESWYWYVVSQRVCMCLFSVGN